MIDIKSLSDIDWNQWKPKDCATLLFVIQEGNVLLIRKKRGLGAGKINAPGGRLDPGESFPECAIREVEEELLITPTLPRKGGELRFQFVDGYSIYVHVFRSAGFTGIPTETDEAKPHWFGVDAIPYDEMWADDRIWVPHLLAGRHFYGDFVFDEDEMLDHHIRLAPSHTQ